MSQLPLRAQVATALGRTAATLSRMTGRGDGSVIGGRVGLVLEPDLLRKLAAHRKLVLVSATNGKTTTTRLIASALRELGEVATNAFGANMPAGHVSALVPGQGRAVRRAGGRREVPPGGARHDRRRASSA